MKILKNKIIFIKILHSTQYQQNLFHLIKHLLSQ